MLIYQANFDDLQEILQLQYLSYQSEADLFGSKDIPPLKQTLDEVIDEYNNGVILKMVNDKNTIIGSVRAKEAKGTVYIGKLMVHPNEQIPQRGATLWGIVCVAMNILSSFVRIYYIICTWHFQV